MEFKFLTRKEFDVLPSDAVIWNRTGVNSKLFHPDSLWENGLNYLDGTPVHFKWSDDRFIDIPKNLTVERIRKYSGVGRKVIVWKCNNAAYQYKKKMELFCKEQGLYF